MSTRQSSKTKRASFGEKLRALRTERGLTQAGLAEALGYKTYNYLNQLENGKKQPTRQFIYHVALFFGVTPEELMDAE